MNVQRRWRCVLREGRDSIKEREKQKCETMRYLHSLKDIAVGILKAVKLNARMMVRMEIVVFTFTTSCIP